MDQVKAIMDKDILKHLYEIEIDMWSFHFQGHNKCQNKMNKVTYKIESDWLNEMEKDLQSACWKCLNLP